MSEAEKVLANAVATERRALERSQQKVQVLREQITDEENWQGVYQRRITELEAAALREHDRKVDE